MNLDDLLCVGIYDQIIFNSTIDRNKKLISGEILEKSHDVLKVGGRLVSIAGQPNADKAKANQITAESLWLNPNGKQLAELGELMENGKVKTHIGHRFPLTTEGLREAHELSATHHAKGKIVIEIK